MCVSDCVCVCLRACVQVVCVGEKKGKREIKIHRERECCVCVSV